MKERQSNIELLRIVSMFLIVLEHLLLIGTNFFSVPEGNQLIAANMIIGFTYVGVNCFILITGYFGANFSWKRMMSLCLICFFYELMGFIVAYSQGVVELDMKALSYIIFPLSHHESWFIRCYVILLFLLPILNAGLERLDKKQYLYVLVLLTILNLYFGWFHKQPNFSGDGYNASQMVYLYVIGRYLNRHVDWENIRAYRKYVFAGWVILSVLWGVIQNISELVHTIPHWNGWAYNNPIVILASIMLFAYFCSIKIPYSRTINMFGASMLGVFLIHMNRYIVNSLDFLYGTIHGVVYSPIISQSLWLQIAVLILMAGVFVIISALFDMPRMQMHKWLLMSFYTHTHTHTRRG